MPKDGNILAILLLRTNWTVGYTFPTLLCRQQLDSVSRFVFIENMSVIPPVRYEQSSTVKVSCCPGDQHQLH